MEQPNSSQSQVLVVEEVKTDVDAQAPQIAERDVKAVASVTEGGQNLSKACKLQSESELTVDNTDIHIVVASEDHMDASHSEVSAKEVDDGANNQAKPPSESREPDVQICKLEQEEIEIYDTKDKVNSNHKSQRLSNEEDQSLNVITESKLIKEDKEATGSLENDCNIIRDVNQSDTIDKQDVALDESRLSERRGQAHDSYESVEETIKEIHDDGNQNNSIVTNSELTKLVQEDTEVVVVVETLPVATDPTDNLIVTLEEKDANKECSQENATLREKQIAESDHGNNDLDLIDYSQEGDDTIIEVTEVIDAPFAEQHKEQNNTDYVDSAKCDAKSVQLIDGKIAIDESINDENTKVKATDSKTLIGSGKKDKEDITIIIDEKIIITEVESTDLPQIEHTHEDTIKEMTECKQDDTSACKIPAVDSSTKKRSVIQDIFDDWGVENTDEDVQSTSKVHDSVEIELKSLLDETKTDQTVSSESAVTSQEKVPSANEEYDETRDIVSTTEKNPTKQSTENQKKNKAISKDAMSLNKNEKNSPVSSASRSSRSMDTRAVNATSHDTAVPKSRSRHLTSQIASPAEVTEVLKERFREKQKNVDAPRGPDIFFVKKLTQRLSSKLAGGPVNPAPKLIPLPQQTASSNPAPSSVTAQSAPANCDKKTTAENTTTEASKDGNSDNKELLAILEGDIDPDWSILKPPVLTEESKTPSTVEHSEQSNPPKLDPLVERELALKQLLELPITPSKKIPSRKKKTFRAAPSRASKDATTDAKTPLATQRKEVNIDLASENAQPNTKSVGTNLYSSSREKSGQKNQEQIGMRIEESRSGRKRKPTEKAREHEQTIKRQKVYRGKVPISKRQMEEKHVSSDSSIENHIAASDATNVDAVNNEKTVAKGVASKQSEDKMGRPCSVPNREAILLIQKYMQYFNTNNFPSSSAKVWKDMSKELNGRWKPHSVYTYVRDNKNGSLEAARQNLGINIQPPRPIPSKSTIEDDIIDELSEDSESDKSSYHDDENGDSDIGVDSFPLVLSPTEWEQIKPDQTSNHQQKRLKSWIWPNVITKAFWNMYKFPCAFLGKWSYVRMEQDENENYAVGSFYLKFKGLCKSKKCNNKIVGIAYKKPVNGELHLIITTRDTRNDYHEEVKRPLNGPERKLIGRKLKRRRAAGYRQKLLAENMKFGENEPPWVQKCHIYRQAKMERNKEDLGIKSGVKMDMITSIRNMLQDIRYSNAIREIGAKKFYVFYCSPEQIFVEKEYCRVRKGFSRICLDATGKVVKKFEVIPGRKTGHIFLYTITINFEGKTLPVYQMLSEKHDAVFITFWLQEWIRACKATIPDEAMSDLGRALLLAMCEAFNRMTLKEYVDVLFKWATKDRYKTPRPFNTLIRADVAHQMAAVARWKCIKDLRHPVVKGFYLRTIALMIDCQTVQEFEHVFRLTCIVALHLDQDKSIMVSGKQVSVFEARRLLEEYMAEHRQIIEELETSRENVEIDEEVENTLNSVEEKDDKNLTVTHQWIKSLISMSTPPDQQKMECKAVNGFYFSEFIQSLERIAKEFPIWTAAALPGKQTHASTASQEGYFAEVRQRIFEGIPLPCSANRFLKEHIDDLHSGTNEVAAKLKHFNHNHRQPVPSPHTPEKESALQKPIRAPSASDKESESPRKAAPVLYSFDEELGFLSQEPISDSCLLDNRLGIFLQDPTPTACAANGELKLTLKKLPCSADQHSEFYSQIPVLSPCSADIESASSVRKPASDSRSADEGKSSLQQPYINMNFNSISLLRERARMVNDSDLKCGEAWKGLVNEESCFVDVNERSPENQEESKNIQDTSQILSEVLDLRSSDIANIDRNLFIQPNNNTHGFSINYEQDKLFTKKDPHAELSTPNSKEVIFSSTPLIDHNYSKLLSDEEEVSTEFPKGDQQNLNPKCNKNKPAKVGFYFQSYPQIRFLNERFDNGGRKGFLLKNGLKLGIIKVGNIAVDLQKTCGFDAIIHILQFGALYDSRYHFFIQSSNNRALKFVCKFMKMGPTMEILRERIVLLNEFYPIVKDPEAPSIKPHKLIAEDSITQIWKNLFCCSEPTEPSAIRSSECNNPECVSSLPIDVAYFEVNIKMINTKGIQALQDAVLFNKNGYQGKCRQKKCPGTVTETTRSNFHIFIDLDTRTHRKKTHGLKYQLADVPITLNLIKQYRLIGVIEHIPGHFIGYCRKPSGRWLKCDDMQLNIEGCDEKTVITPIGAIYIAL